MLYHLFTLVSDNLWFSNMDLWNVARLYWRSVDKPLEYSDIFKATEYSQPCFDLPSDRYTVIQDERRHNSSTSPKDLFSKDTRRDVQTKRCNTTRNKNHRSIYIFILIFFLFAILLWELLAARTFLSLYLFTIYIELFLYLHVWMRWMSALLHCWHYNKHKQYVLARSLAQRRSRRMRLDQAYIAFAKAT